MGKRGFIVSVGIILATFGHAAAHGDEGAALFPVRILPTLGIASLDEIQAKWVQPFPAGPYQLMRPETSPNDQGSPTTIDVDSCQSLDHAIADGYSMAGDVTFPIVQGWLGYCEALAALKTAKPSRRSDVASFELNERAPEFLPLRVTGSVELAQAEYDSVEAQGLSWAAWRRAVMDAVCDARPIATPEVPGVSTWEFLVGTDREFCGARGPLQGKYQSEGVVHFVEPYVDNRSLPPIERVTDVTTIRLIAYGDFDGDGNEDVLVQSDWGQQPLDKTAPVTAGGNGWTTSWILTRERFDAPLRTVREVCRVEMNGCVSHRRNYFVD